MRVIWLFICISWGLVISINAPEEICTIEDVLIAFPLMAVMVSLGTLNIMTWVPPPSDVRCIGMGLNPWIPLGLLKVGTGTFLFTGLSGLIFSLLGIGHALWMHLQLVSVGSGGLVGVWAACFIYRKSHEA